MPTIHIRCHGSRVKLSAAMGEALLPHPQWRRLRCAVGSYYPPVGLAVQTQALLVQMLESMPAFVSLLINHRPKSLYGRSLLEVMDLAQRQPARLAALYRRWGANPSEMYRAPPVSGVCRCRSGARRWRDQCGRRKLHCCRSCSPIGRFEPPSTHPNFAQRCHAMRKAAA